MCCTEYRLNVTCIHVWFPFEKFFNGCMCIMNIIILCLILYDSMLQTARSSSVNKTYTASVECTGTEHNLSDCIRYSQYSLSGQQVNFVACKNGQCMFSKIMHACSDKLYKGLRLNLELQLVYSSFRG